MKKLSFFLTMALVAVGVNAQNYESIKNTLILGPATYKKAKEDVDKGMANAKFAGKPEAYILKTTVYANLAVQEPTKDSPEGEQLRNEADAAFTKYKEMQPDLALVKDPVYQQGPVNLYSSFYSAGYKDYEAKKWPEAFTKFEKTAELSDLLIAQKILTTALDTNVMILAGVSAEQAGKKDEAAKYYTRLADKKINGDGFESVYRFLVNYHFAKKDIPSFEKYKAMGKELFPKSEFFTYDKIDFAVGLEDDFAKKVAALEEMVAADPNGYKANELLGEIIYDTLNSRKEGAALPSNADELEKKMVTAFTKSAAAKPEEVNPYLFLGDHFINKSIRVNDAREAHVKDMRARTKPTAAPSKEDAAKRDALDKEYAETMELARPYYEKAAEMFAPKVASLSRQDKQQYKKVAGYLGDIYANKKIQAKGKPAEIAKFTAEEKKWSDTYDSIKN
jgi:hypothetical protein